MDKTWSLLDFPGLTSSDLSNATEIDLVRFPRGYFITSGSPLELGGHWRNLRVGGYAISWDARTSAASASDGTHTIFLVGKAIHLGISTASLQDIAQHLLVGSRISRDELHARLYDLAGRYVVAAFGPTGAYLQTDATGMRSAYFGANGGVVASHASLAAMLTGDERPSIWGSRTWFRETGASMHPGAQTEFASVRVLTPNLELDISRAKVSRVGPSRHKGWVSAHDVASQLVPLIREQLSMLIAGGKVLVSLTAGLDSRTTLALTRPFAEQITYFTYVTRKSTLPSASEGDMKFASNLAHSLGLDHQIVTVDEPVPSGAIDAAMRTNSRRRHIPSVALAYRAQLPADAIHIRSNIYEVGRAFFRSSTTKALPDLNALELARRLVRDREHPTFPASVTACQEWLDETGFSVIEGYDPYDLLYWELRMGKWLSAAMVESDIAHDTYTLVNSRHILELLLSVPDNDRLTALTFDWLIKMTWPELLSYPVNEQVRLIPDLE